MSLKIFLKAMEHCRIVESHIERVERGRELTEAKELLGLADEVTDIREVYGIK